jgi:hypothetical protein
VTPSKPKQLSKADERTLGRLAKKYGRETIAEAAKRIPLPRPAGRPSRGLEPYWERVNLADWIEEAAEEHRAAGSRKPYEDAEVELFQLTRSPEEQREPGAFQRFQKTLRRKRAEGRRGLELARETAKKRARIIRA